MFTKASTQDSHNGLVDSAAASADRAIKSTQRVTNEKLDELSVAVEDARKHAAPLLNRASEQASALAQRSMEAVRNGSQQLREKAMDATDSTVRYIQEEPIKAVLIAAATGAALATLLGMLSRSRSRA